MENKELIEKYPFLMPRNDWTGEVVEDYDYSYTLLDDLEPGWKIRFGMPFIEDLREVLVKNNCLDNYLVVQIKEKFGSLRWYSYGEPEEWLDHMYAWEYISEHTCKKCGKFPVPMRDDGWLSPWCDECFRSIHPKATEEDFKKWSRMSEELLDGKPLEYIIYTIFSNSGNEILKIDMKPYYEKIGYTGEVV